MSWEWKNCLSETSCNISGLLEASDGKLQLSVTHPSLFNIFIHDLEKGVSNVVLKFMKEIKMERICKH